MTLLGYLCTLLQTDAVMKWSKKTSCKVSAGTKWVRQCGDGLSSTESKLEGNVSNLHNEFQATKTKIFTIPFIKFVL